MFLKGDAPQFRPAGDAKREKPSTLVLGLRYFQSAGDNPASRYRFHNLAQSNPSRGGRVACDARKQPRIRRGIELTIIRSKIIKIAIFRAIENNCASIGAIITY